jgi:uncharacterized LabA/DUF88 family protein
VFKRKLRTAVLVDFDNVIVSFGHELTHRIAHWTQWIEQGEFDPARRARRITVRRVYWNEHNNTHRAAFEAAGFEVAVCRAVRKEKASSADFVITIDAMDLAYEKKSQRPDEIILLTFDSDFLTLVNRLEVNDVATAAMIDPARPPSLHYRENADSVIHIQRFREAMSYEPPKRRWWWSRRPDPCGLAPEVDEPRPKPAPARRSPPPPPRASAPAGSVAPQFDLAGIAPRVVAAGERIPGGVISRNTLLKLLADVPGFEMTGRTPWLGCKSYRGMIQQLARVSPDLTLWRHPTNKGIALAYRPREG